MHRPALHVHRRRFVLSSVVACAPRTRMATGDGPQIGEALAELDWGAEVVDPGCILGSLGLYLVNVFG